MTCNFKETTILVPHENRLNVDGWLMEHKHLTDSDPDDVYWFTFIPATMDDSNRIEYKADEASMKMEMDMGPYSNKRPKKEFYHGGNFLVSQLNKPRITSEIPTGNLNGAEVSMRLNFRDDPTGKIFLNCSFLEFYSKESEEEKIGPPPEDYDFWA